MKSRTTFILVIGIIVLASAVFTFFTRLQEPAQIISATINRDCAPWDGSAFTLSVPIQDGTIMDISIWQSPDINRPVTFSFPDDTGQVGNAVHRVAEGEYEPLTGSVLFWRISAEKSVEGRFSLRSETGGQFQGRFEAEWGNAIAMCG